MPARPDHETVPGGLLALTGDLVIVSANPRLARLVQRDIGELVGQSIDVLLSASSRILFQTHVYPALSADGEVEEALLTLTGRNGERIPVLLNAVRAPRPDGSTYQALMMRIQARARWEQDLLDATKELARQRADSERLAVELSRALDDLNARHEQERRDHAFRDAFIGVVSHELRTPITTVYGMSHVLRDHLPSLEPSVVLDQLDDIVSEADRLRRLVEDLLILSRAEGGKLEVARDPVLLGHVVERVAAAEASRSRRKVTTRLDEGLPLVLGEETYLEQIVRNLVSNAIKYSPDDTSVTVGARRSEDGVTVSVTDEGTGLPAEGRERLFEVFYRDPVAVRQSSGAGIGLFVTRELVHAMDGRIWAEDAGPPPVHGARFAFWLPAMPEDDGPG